MRYSVLVVDDSLTVRMDLCEAFESGDFRVVLCGTGAEARAALARERVDVAVLDIRLPDADGIELLTELRARPEHRDTVVLLLSSEAEVRDRVHGLRTGADEYVGKPYDAGYVVARSRQLVRERAPTRVGRPAILVIEDSATFREHVRSALENEGYLVTTAATGEEGLRLAADRRPNAIIVDGGLPGIDGATVIRRIRLDAALRDTPCLLLTASDDYATELLMLDAGADAFVRKQGDLAIVLGKLTAILRRSAAALPIGLADSVHGPTKVLAVHSDPGRLRSIADLLRDDGYDIVLAKSADDALTMLAAQPTDCVLLELDLPGLDGSQACQRIKAVPGLRDVPLIMVGDRDDPGAVLDCLAAGADDYVCVIGDAETLRAHVRAQIRRKQSQDESRRIRDELLRRELDAAAERAARELAETRAALVEELEWRNRELEAFTGSVSHDLRGPIQIIAGFAEVLLEDNPEQLGEGARDSVRRIQAASQRMIELVDSLLVLARASREELRRTRLDLSATARAVAMDLGGRDPSRSVRFVVADDMVADGDAGLVRVVLENLVGNALKFTRHTERPLIEVGTVVLDGQPAYFVRDNGAGFPGEQASRLFRPFARLHSAQDFPGTGIGLTTVHRIVDRHGGRIAASGEVGRGATFTFTLSARPG